MCVVPIHLGSYNLALMTKEIIDFLASGIKCCLCTAVIVVVNPLVTDGISDV